MTILNAWQTDAADWLSTCVDDALWPLALRGSLTMQTIARLRSIRSR